MRLLRGEAVVVLAAILATTACATSPLRPSGSTASHAAVTSDDDIISSDLNELMSVIRKDLTLNRTRERERIAVLQPASHPTSRSGAVRSVSPRNVSPFESEIASRRIVMGPAMMPVAGVSVRDLVDTWGAPRDGGKRRHRGIDIFAPRGTQIYAIADGVITYVGEQPKGGKCLWLSTEDGMAFYYAHLDRWAPGIYEGMQVNAGTVLGYVGNTGNARSTPSHLHLSVRDGDVALNPYTFLRYGRGGSNRVGSSSTVAAAGGR